MEHTFQSRFGRRTARCSLCLRWGTESEASEEHDGAEWHERESKEELAEEASQSRDPSKLRSVLRRSLSMNVAPSGAFSVFLPSIWAHPQEMPFAPAAVQS